MKDWESSYSLYFHSMVPENGFTYVLDQLGHKHRTNMYF